MLQLVQPLVEHARKVRKPPGRRKELWLRSRVFIGSEDAS
jgi:hypothetical protein